MERGVGIFLMKQPRDLQGRIKKYTHLPLFINQNTTSIMTYM